VKVGLGRHHIREPPDNAGRLLATVKPNNIFEPVRGVVLPATGFRSSPMTGVRGAYGVEPGSITR
jgi:hypothetical protein